MVELAIKVELEGENEEGMLGGELEDRVIEINLATGPYRDNEDESMVRFGFE